MRLIENGEIIFHRIHKFHEVYIIHYVSFLHLFLCYDDKRGEAMIAVATTRVYAARINSFNVWLSISVVHRKIYDGETLRLL